MASRVNRVVLVIQLSPTESGDGSYKGSYSNWGNNISFALCISLSMVATLAADRGRATILNGFGFLALPPIKAVS